MKRHVIIAVSAIASLALTACSSTSHSMSHATSSPSGMSDTTHPSGAMSSHNGMNMPMTASTGLDATKNGYTLNAESSLMTDMPTAFTITNAGKPVTAFDVEQTKLMHFYLIRTDLTGFQHLHPTMAEDGTWHVTPTALTPGSYRLYVQFTPHAAAAAGAMVLSTPVSVAGDASTANPLPTPSSKTTIDGYVLEVAGTPKAGTETPITITVTKAGAPVTDLQPYLDTYAHVTAIHEGDLAFAHLHPSDSASAGPALVVNADLPEPGAYRMFIQFQTAGTLHTAAVTISAA